MNWDAIGAIAELGGAIAVVATLVYLARQLRDNTKSVRLQSLDSTFKEWNEHLKEGQSGEGAGLALFKVQKGELLTELEEYQLGFLFRRIFNTFSKVHYLKGVDAIDEFNSESIETGLPYLVKLDFFERWWPIHKDRYAEKFQQYVDNRIREIQQSEDKTQTLANKTTESDT